MKYLFPMLFFALLSACGQSDFSAYKGEFPFNKPATIHPDSMEGATSTSIADKELLKKLLTPIYDNEEAVNEAINYFPAYFHSWFGQSQGLNKFSILMTQDESGCNHKVIYYVTKAGEILDTKVVSFDECLEMGIARGNFKLINDSSFLVHNYNHHYADYLPKPFVEECTISAEGKISCNKREMSVGACLWEKLSVREKPADDAKYLTSINLGERIDVLGKYQVDEKSDKKNEYALIKLSDDSQGWVQRRFIAENAYPAAITNETYIYKRADPLTRTNDKFYQFDVVAILDRDDDQEWFKVKGKPRGGSWFKEGWIKADNFTLGKKDIAYSVLAAAGISVEDYDNLVTLVEDKSFDDVEVSLRKALHEYLGIENIRTYTGDEIEMALNPYLGNYPNVIQEIDAFIRYNETCEQSSINIDGVNVNHDMIMDSESYKISSVEVKNFGDEILIYIESLNYGEPGVLSIMDEFGVSALAHDWYGQLEYYVHEDDWYDLREDPEECIYDEEGI